MKLYCVRHGQALPPSPTESDPGLSPEGGAGVMRIARYLSKKNQTISHFYSSYKERAKQTVAIFHEELEALEQPQVSSLLDPAKPLEPLFDEVNTWTDDTLIVGHMPIISEFVSRLVSNQGDEQLVKFTPGTVVCLERGDGNNWVIGWVLRPDMLFD